MQDIKEIIKQESIKSNIDQNDTKKITENIFKINEIESKNFKTLDETKKLLFIGK